MGKSTTVHAMGMGLSLKGFKVLVVDFDPQCNLSYSMQAEHGKPTSYEVVTGKVKAKDAIQMTGQGDLIPASANLSGSDMELDGVDLLKRALQPIRAQYDYIIIDTPPALGMLTINALTAADTVIMTAQADIFSLQGVGQLYGTIEKVRSKSNPSLNIMGILLTRHSSRSVLSRDITEILNDTAKQFNTKVFNTSIRECIALKEAQAKRQSVFYYAPKSNAAIDYASFTEEVTGGAKP